MAFLCPACGREMTPGEMESYRGDDCFWAPTAFFEKHVLNPRFHRLATIRREGGIPVKIRSRIMGRPTVGYGCPHCQLVLIDCRDRD